MLLTIEENFEFESIETDFIDNKIKINPDFLNIRNKIVEYIDIISTKLKLHEQTFFISVSILDLIIEKNYKLLIGKHYKFIGLTILWISSKYEEVYQIDTDDLITLLDYEYRKDDFIDFETKILFSIKFKIPRYTLYSSLESYLLKEPKLNNKNLFNKCIFYLKKEIYIIPKEKPSTIIYKIVQETLENNKNNF